MPGEQELRAALNRVHFESPLEVRSLTETLRDFAAATKAVLGDGFLGLYINGSLTMGDFEPASSDVDFLPADRLARATFSTSPVSMRNLHASRSAIG